MKLRSFWFTSVRLFIGVILLVAGVTKVTDFGAFIRQVALYDLVPIWVVSPASHLIVSAEITGGILLILGYYTRGAVLLSAGLFSVFIVALLSAQWRALPIDECGCGNFLFDLLGVESSLGWKPVLFDLVLLAGSFLIARTRPPCGYGVDFYGLSNR